MFIFLYIKINKQKDKVAQQGDLHDLVSIIIFNIWKSDAWFLSLDLVPSSFTYINADALFMLLDLSSAIIYINVNLIHDFCYVI